MLNTTVTRLLIKDGICYGVALKEQGQHTANQILKADAVIVATGGLSYQSTGSTGDGLTFAKQAGHTIEPCVPALVPMNIAEKEICASMMGLSLRNVELKAEYNNKVYYKGFGEMLFTHFGISGPLVLTASSYLSSLEKKPVKIKIDLKPALDLEQLQLRLTREFEASNNKAIKNVVTSMYPSKMVAPILSISGIDPDQRVNSITKEERLELLKNTKEFTLTMAGFRDYNEAIITHGGVNVKEVNPQTMESKLVSHLYFCGEVLDVDAQTGGYNLQVAWSTAYAAAINLEYV